jgi:hypothetical protein
LTAFSGSLRAEAPGQLVSGSGCFLVMLVKPRPGPPALPSGEARRERMTGRGDVAITTNSRQRPPFQGLVLHPSHGGFHGDEVLRDRGNICPT